MKIVVPTSGRARTIETHRWLDASGLDYVIAVHNEQEAEAYSKNPTLDPKRIVVHGAPRGVVHARQACLEMAAMGEWVLMLDDDIRRCEMLCAPHYWEQEIEVPENRYSALWRKRFNTICTAERLMKLIQLDLAVAEKIGAHLVGWAPVDNYLFRTVKYRTAGYVIGQAFCVKRSDLNYDMNVKSMDDMSFSCQNIVRFGTVLINHFIEPIARHYQPGGIGPYEERLPERLQDTHYMMERYPGLLRYKKRKYQHPEGDLAFRIHSAEGIERWRASVSAPDLTLETVETERAS